jgi:hypothetical protein
MAKQPGLDHRHCDNGGETRRKNGNTLIRTLRKSYGEDFGAGFRVDMKLESFLRKANARSLSDYLKNR